jgi:hypothetical protein
MKPLVIQFQEDLTIGSKEISNLLRTAKLISSKLGKGKIEDWIDHELNGYPVDSALPEYRIISGGQLQFYNPYHGWLPAMTPAILDIPISEPITKLAVYKRGDRFYLSPPEKYPLTDESGSSQPIMSFPQRIECNVSAVIAIVEGVKTRLVDWSIELEKQGILGENMSFKEEEKTIANNQTFNIEHMTGIIGDVIHSNVGVYDYSSIHKIVEERGIPQEERNRLEEIMDGLKESDAQKKAGWLQKGKDWIVKNQEFLGASASIVRKALGLELPT